MRQAEGALIIFAGAGSGKTRVLTYRIANLLQSGVSPFRILAVTFTNRAATEMRQRVRRIAGDGARDVWISTFHSFAVRVLRQEVRYLPYDSNFTIYDNDDQLTVIKHCLQDLDIDDKKYRPRSLLAGISNLKNDLVTPEDYARSARSIREQTLARIYAYYQAKLLQQNALDFDDLLSQTVELFRTEPRVLENYQYRFQYIMVDEYQDTNHAQYELVRLLADGYRNLCVVGDDDQSIYGWRGADIRNILDFEKDYPEARVVKLEQNYRSTQRILAVANSVIAHNRGRKPKQLWTSNGIGEPVYYYQAVDENDEARFVTTAVEKLCREEELQYRDFAVFYRTHAQSRAFEEECIRKNIPYRIFGGIRFYERREIKDVIAYLRFVANPADEISLRRIINVPRRGIGEVTLARATEAAAQDVAGLVDVLSQPGLAPGLGTRTARTLTNFFNMVDGWRRLQEELGIAGLVEKILDETGYRSELVAEKTIEAETRLENLKEFVGMAQRYDEESEDKSLAGFLEQLALVADIDNYQTEENALVLMTVHSAKGLEFPVVFLTGLEEGIFPHARSLDEEQKLEEERRLCYVGITRAEQRLFFSWACRRFLHGDGAFREPSRFLGEIPEEFLYPVIPGGERETPEQQVPGTKPKQNQQLPPIFTGRTLLEAAADRESGRTVATGEAVEEQQDNWFQIGDRVEHKKFGQGRVTEVKVGHGGDLEVYVSFDAVGVKHLLVKYAPLQKV